MKHARAIAQLVAGFGTYAALRATGILTGWPNIPLPIGSLPVSGDSVQVLLSGVASMLPNIVDVTWVADVIAMPTRVKELHAETFNDKPRPEKPSEAATDQSA